MGALLDIASSERLDGVGLGFVTPEHDRARFSLRMRETSGEAREAVLRRVEGLVEAAGLRPVVIAGLYDLQAQLGRLIASSLRIGIGGLLLLFVGVAWVVARDPGTAAKMWICLAAIPAVSFFAYGTNRFGVRVATGDIDGDGIDEIVTAPGPGEIFSPHIRAFDYDGAAVSPISAVSFSAYEEYSEYGATVATADLDGDGIDEIITGPGPGEHFASRVRAWDYDGTAPVHPMEGIDFTAYDPALFGYGVKVAGGEM